MINPYISDLFFNLDLSTCAIEGPDGFLGWDDAKLREEAEWFNSCLGALGAPSESIDDLIADFHKRV